MIHPTTGRLHLPMAPLKRPDGMLTFRGEKAQKPEGIKKSGTPKEPDAGVEFKNWYLPTNTDFERHLKDYQDNHWFLTDLPWGSDVESDVRANLDSKSLSELEEITRISLPVTDYPKFKIEQVMTSGLPSDSAELAEMKNAIVERQIQALVTIANHGSTAEQIAVTPLSQGIGRYQRYKALQELLTCFVKDEEKHSAVFDKYLKEHLNGRVVMQKNMVTGNKLMNLVAQRTEVPAVILSIVIETVGAAFFEFFGEHAPDPLFRTICKQIAQKDERRHMETVVDLYNEFYNQKRNNGSKAKIWWENLRNKMVLKGILKKVYSEPAKESHYMMKSCRAFGIEPKRLTDYIGMRLDQEFAKIDFHDVPKP